MRLDRKLVFDDCTAFAAAVEAPRSGEAIRQAVGHGELFEVRGHRFRVCRSGAGWKIKTATLWQMTHRQRFARLQRCLRLGGDDVTWERRVRNFVKHGAVSLQYKPDGAPPRVLPCYTQSWLPPRLDDSNMLPETREAGRRRLGELRQYRRQEVGQASRQAMQRTIPRDTDLRCLCPAAAAELFGPGARLAMRNLRDSDFGPLDLSNADLWLAVLIRCRARGANFSGALLEGADLRGADLRDADLTEAKLRGAKLAGTRLRNARLDGADLRGQTLDATALAGASLRGANLDGACLVLADDALSTAAKRQALLKPLDQREGNLLYTVASLSDPVRRRELMHRIVQALRVAVGQGEDVSDCHPVMAELLLKHIEEYWSNPCDLTADTTLTNWIHALAKHQCLTLARAVPQACDGPVLQLADRYRTLFSELSGGYTSWAFMPALRENAARTNCA